MPEALIEGQPLVLEDLNITMQVVTYEDPWLTYVYKRKGRVSKRRFRNMMRMAKRPLPMYWMGLLND